MVDVSLFGLSIFSSLCLFMCCIVVTFVSTFDRSGYSSCNNFNKHVMSEELDMLISLKDHGDLDNFLRENSIMLSGGSLSMHNLFVLLMAFIILIMCCSSSALYSKSLKPSQRCGQTCPSS